MIRFFLIPVLAVMVATGAEAAGRGGDAKPLSAAETGRAGALYQTHCASCHGETRLGGQGPALLPGNLGRLRPKNAVSVIAKGRPATQMPAFAEVLAQDEIALLSRFIYTPPAIVPVWGLNQMRESHVIHATDANLPKNPVHKADPLNLFTVVETGDHHVTILDGDAFEPLARIPTRFALHGGAKYSPDGRFVYLGSRDGWVSKYDLYSFQLVAEIRAGINMRNIAVSADGRYVAAGNYLPNSLVILRASDLTPIKLVDVADSKGKTSRVSAVYTAPPRESFVVALKDIPEIWEISYKDKPEPVALGKVHNYQPDQLEGAFDFGPFPVRRIQLKNVLDDFFFDQSYRNILGASRSAKNGQVVNLTVGRKIADLDLAGMPHLGSGITLSYKGHPAMATPHLSDGIISVIDMTTWKTVKKIKTLGPGFFMRSHDGSAYAWTDVFFGPDKDALHVVDLKTLEIVKTIRPSPGVTAGHVEFTRNGSHALVSVWAPAPKGALVIYDAKTLEEVKRIPMNRPVGKYNVFNKISYGRGTSH